QGGLAVGVPREREKSPGATLGGPLESFGGRGDHEPPARGAGPVARYDRYLPSPSVQAVSDGVHIAAGTVPDLHAARNGVCSRALAGPSARFLGHSRTDPLRG